MNRDGIDEVFQSANKYSMVMLDTPNKKGRRRLDQITLGVIHYTGSSSLEGTLAWFQSPEAKVSAHYVIAADGAVVQFGDLEDVLWHAGRSEWLDRKWCNKYSIGYEVVCGPKGRFTPSQITSLHYLLRMNIQSTGMTAVVGHEHISPGRKIDPGNCVNWHTDFKLPIIDPDNQLEYFSNQRIDHVNVIEEYLKKDQSLASSRNIPIEHAKELNEMNRAKKMIDGRGGSDFSWLPRLFRALFQRSV